MFYVYMLFNPIPFNLYCIIDHGHSHQAVLQKYMDVMYVEMFVKNVCGIIVHMLHVLVQPEGYIKQLYICLAPG